MAADRHFWIYMLASQIGGTLYIGMTNDLTRRIHEHRTGALAGFSKRYGVTRLVWFESVDNLEAAFIREKQLKEWRRAWKVRLIEETNPNWDDLYPQLMQGSL